METKHGFAKQCAAESGLPDDLYTQLQSIFRLTPAVLVGSGFSCGYGLPSMGDLGRHLVANVDARLISPEAKLLWAQAHAAVNANLEAGLNTIPQSAAGREEVVAKVRELTAELILQATAAAEEKILECHDAKSHAPVRLLSKLFSGSPQNVESIGVITTNYDTLLELFCDLAELPLDNGFSGFRRRRPRSAPLFQTQYSRVWTTERRGVQAGHRPCKTIRLHKPHGSINWLSTDEGPIEVLNDSSFAPRAIVVPGPSKYQDALVNVLFDSMRTEMNAVISSATALLCIGFGFNDDHLQGVINARLESHMPMVLLTRGVTENIERLLGVHPHVIGFFMEGDGSICRWRGKDYYSDTPLWQLDDFLKNFLE